MDLYLAEILPTTWQLSLSCAIILSFTEGTGSTLVTQTLQISQETGCQKVQDCACCSGIVWVRHLKSRGLFWGRVRRWPFSAFSVKRRILWVYDKVLRRPQSRSPHHQTCSVSPIKDMPTCNQPLVLKLEFLGTPSWSSVIACGYCLWTA